MLIELGAVVKERFRQDKKWGGQKNDIKNTNQDWIHYIRLRLEEISTLCQLNVDPKQTDAVIWQCYVEIAALAIAALQTQVFWSLEKKWWKVLKFVNTYLWQTKKNDGY